VDEDLRGFDGNPCQGIAPWNRSENEDGRRHRWLNSQANKAMEWLPRPTAGRTLPLTSREETTDPVYVQIVPGPGNLFQIVRVDLKQPVARGFHTKASARAWLEAALFRGVLPKGVVELEGQPEMKEPDE